MKTLISYIPVNEDIHSLKNRLEKAILESSPDYIFIVVGEGLAIHSPMISELHMFEYSNVRFAVWNLVEDILYRVEDIPNYYISVYPLEGVYTCKETGYKGIFKGVSYPIGYIQYEYVRKLVNEEVEKGDKYIIYSDYLDGGLFLWETFRDLIGIDKFTNRDTKVYTLDKEVPDYLYIYQPQIGWYNITSIPDMDDQDIGLLKLLGYVIDNGYLNILIEEDIRRKILDRLEDVMNKFEYIYYNHTSSDREGYELNVLHGRDIGIPLSVSAKIIYILNIFGDIDIETKMEISSRYSYSRECWEVLTDFNRETLKDGDKLLEYINDRDFLIKLVRHCR